MTLQQRLNEIRKRVNRTLELEAMEHYGLESGCDAWVELKELQRKNIRDEYFLLRALEIAIDALEDANDFSASNLERMEHLFDARCIPTVDEVNQCSLADSELRLALSKIQKLAGEECPFNRG